MAATFKSVITGKRQMLQRIEKDFNNCLLYLQHHRNDEGAHEAETDLTWAQIYLRRAIRAVGGKVSGD